MPTLLFPSLSQKLILGIDFWKLFKINLTFTDAVENKPNEVEPDEHKVHNQKLINIPINNIIGETGHELSSVNLSKLQKAINNFQIYKEGQIGTTNLLRHTIDTGDASPIKQRYYPVSPYLQAEVNKELERMLELGVIEPSSSPWSSPIVMVKKPNGKIRLCLDSRKLNEVTKKDSYPLPYISRILGNIVGSKYLSSVDLKDAFWQIPLEETSKEKTAFTVPSRGLYQFRRLPFGLNNAAQSQSRLMDRVLGYDLEPHVFVYLDDIIIATNEFDTHIKMLREVAARLKQANLTVNIEKSQFCKNEMKYLGYVLDKNGLHTDPIKIKAITDYPIPKNIKQIRSLIGMASWYRRFINNYSTLLSPLSDLTKKTTTKFKWTKSADEAFNSLKQVLTHAPVLCNPDFNSPFIVQTDASDVGIGGVLVQGEGANEQVIAFMSHKLTSAQRNYSPTERECLAVILAIEFFRPYVEGTDFTVITDHASLLWLLNVKQPTGRIARWILRLQSYNFTLVHRKGKFNVVPDALSRAIDEIDVTSADFNEDLWYNKLRDKISVNPVKFPNFRIEGQTIFKHIKVRNTCMNNSEDWKLVIPTNMRDALIVENHDPPQSSHFGYYKTMKRLQEKYFWPKMSSDVSSYIKSCKECKANKDPTHVVRNTMGQQKPADRPWKILSVDFLGPLPRSKEGNTILLVLIDCFTKYTILCPMRKADTVNMIKLIEKEVFFKFGVPEIIISDNGPQFIANDFQHFLETHSVKHWPNAVYHPQHNPAERPNKVIASAIRNYVKSDHRSWDHELTHIACAINTASHKSSKFSPYYLNFGRNMATSGLTHKLISTRNSISDHNQTITIEDEISKLHDAQKEVVKNLKHAYDAQAKYYNLRSKPREFEEGDTVWYKNFVQSNKIKNISAKLCPRYKEGRIRSKIGSSTYLLEDSEGNPINKFNAKDLKS